MGSESERETSTSQKFREENRIDFLRIYFSFLTSTHNNNNINKMGTEADAKDAFIIFDEAYEGNDVDAFYIPDILRALGCNCTNATCIAAGAAAELGVKRVTFEDFLPIWTAVKSDLKDTGCKEDYIEGLKVFDKDGTGKVPMAEVQNVLCSLGEKLEGADAANLFTLLGITADEEDMISYMELIDKLIGACA